jgi:hypothetical protein
MGFLDKAKAAAEKVAEEAKKGTAQVQDKVEHTQTRKKADDLAKQLGYLIAKEGTGTGDADRLVAEIQVLEAKLAAAPDPGAGDAAAG